MILRSLYIVFCFGLTWSVPAFARPIAPDLFCKVYPNSPSCLGTLLACSYCHKVVPPTLNSYGESIRAAYLKNGQSFPDNEDDFRKVLLSIENTDSDGDGESNSSEIAAGTLPGNPTSKPTYNGCKANSGSNAESLVNNFYKLCTYDDDYAYKKIWNLVCGEPPSWEELQKFVGLDPSKKKSELVKTLEMCVDSENWLGKDGVLWEIGHYKIRPVGSVKSGEDASLILPIVDYYDDYHLFIYTQIDGHDARDQLLADYAVTRSIVGGKTSYTRQVPERLTDGIVMQPEYRVGLVTSFWNLAFYLNYTAVARVLVAQAYNAYLGVNLSVMQGLASIPPSETQFKDYDAKGVERPECAICHTTLDPLAYPFRNYNGLTGSTKVLAGKSAPGLQNVKKLGDKSNLTPLSYSTSRMEAISAKYPGITAIPETGMILGQRVENLHQWAEVIVNSDQFAQNTVRDYWKVLMGHAPRSEEMGEFIQLWKDFKGIHNYDVEAMLADLIKTEAFGVP